MGRFGVGELVIILAIALILFGANRLQGLGKALGKNIREFKNAMSGGAESDDTSDPTTGKVDPKKKRGGK